MSTQMLVTSSSDACSEHSRLCRACSLVSYCTLASSLHEFPLLNSLPLARQSNYRPTQDYQTHRL